MVNDLPPLGLAFQICIGRCSPTFFLSLLSECECIACVSGDLSVPLFLLLALSWSNRCLSLLLVTASPHTFHLNPPLKGVHTIIEWQERRVYMCMFMSCIRCSVFACTTGLPCVQGGFWRSTWVDETLGAAQKHSFPYLTLRL